MFASFHSFRLLRRCSPIQIPLFSFLPTAISPNLLFVAPVAVFKPISHCRPTFLQQIRRSGLNERAHFCTLLNQVDSTASSYISVRIRCFKGDADMLSEALLSFGANSSSMDVLSDSLDHDEISITCIFTDDQDVDSCISYAMGSIGLNYVPKYEVSAGEDCDWVKNVQETFHPIEVASGLWIVPKWRETPDLQATNIILDPGMAFGTGEHPTTKLCLMLLHKFLNGGEKILDYGTGSGVLGIAAIKLGSAMSVGIDIDPQSIISARQNIALNGIDSSKMRVFLVPNKTSSSSLADAETSMIPEDRNLLDLELKSSKGNFDIVLANILLNPLMELAKDIVTYGKPGAHIGLSGILSEQVQQIKEIYSQYLDNISITEMLGWACLHGTRKETLKL